MHIFVFEKLFNDGCLNADTLQNIKMYQKQPVVSVHYDLLTLLYTGIFLLTTALGIIIYLNIDTIGHLALVITIAVATLACFGYCIGKAPGFRWEKVETPGIFFDYVVLLGCLLLLVLTGYLQAQYNIFGHRWGLATFVPMVVLFAAAYYFDHLGVLSMAVINLAAWVGIAVTPLHLLRDNNFNDSTIIYSGIGLGMVLWAVGFLSRQRRKKPHFYFTYQNFGCHMLLVALLAAMVLFKAWYILWLLAVAVAALFVMGQAWRQRSYYFFVVSALYLYAGLSYVIINFLIRNTNFNLGIAYLVLTYLVGSCITLVFLLMKYNKILHAHARIQ